MCNSNKYKSWNKSKQSDFNEIPHDQNRGICDLKFRPFNHIDPLVGSSQGNKEWHLERNAYDRLLRPKKTCRMNIPSLLVYYVLKFKHLNFYLIFLNLKW